MSEVFYSVNEYRDALARIERKQASLSDFVAWGFKDSIEERDKLQEEYDRLLESPWSLEEEALTPRARIRLCELGKRSLVSGYENCYDNTQHLDNYRQSAGSRAPERNGSEWRNAEQISTGYGYRETALPTCAETTSGSCPSTAPEPIVPRFADYALKVFEKKWSIRGKQKSHAQNERTALGHLSKAFGDKPLNEITLGDIQALYAQNQGYSESTLHKWQIVLNYVFKWAIEEGYITHNPAASLQLMIGGSKEIPRESLTREQALDIYHQLIERGSHKPIETFIMIALFSGLRRGEILALRWENIDEDIIHVKQSVAYQRGHTVLKEPKSKSGFRSTTIPNQLREWLKPIRKESGYVITARNGDLICESTFGRWFKQAQKDYNLYNATAHTFRHTFATLMAPHVSPLELQMVLGHSDMKTTKRYVDQQTERAAALSSINILQNSCGRRSA